MKTVIYILTFFTFCFGQDEGLKFYNNGDFKSAQNYYEDILDKKKDHEGAKFGLGASLFKENRSDIAGELFRSLINSKDKELASNAAFNYANILKDEKKNKESLEFFKESIKLNPNNKNAKINYEILKNIIKSEKDQSEQDQSEQDQSEQDQSEQDQSEQDQSEQDQSEQDQSEQDQSEKDQSEQDQSEQDQSEQDQSEQDQSEKDQSEQDQSEQDQSEQDQSEQGQLEDQKPLKNNRKTQADSFLDALKTKEKINKVRQIQSSKSITLEKDW